MQDVANDTTVIEEKIGYIFRQYPKLIHDQANNDFTLLQNAIAISRFNGISAICQAAEQVI